MADSQPASSSAPLPPAAFTPASRRVSPESALKYLSQIDLLHALPPEEAHELAPYVELVEVPAGQVVFAQGDVGDALYLVKEGTARTVLNDGTEIGRAGAGQVFGEMALLSGEPRSASVIAETDLTLLRISRGNFLHVLEVSPILDRAFHELAAAHSAGRPVVPPEPLDRGAWRGRAVRALDARRRGLQGWQAVMGFGVLIWALLFLNEGQHWFDPEHNETLVAVLELIAGLTIIQGACESFVQGVERLGARLRWGGFVSGTLAEAVSTFPEFVVITFLVVVQPLAAFITAVVTIYNNALAFSIYSFFLPKDQKGTYLMPRSLTRAGGEVLVAGSGIALIIGVIMLVLRAETPKTSLVGADLFFIGAVFLTTYVFYTYALVLYYAEGDEEDHPARPPDPHTLGHDTGWTGIGLMFLLGVAGSYLGGESIGGFADTALNHLGLPTIPTAAGLAFFAGISEYIIVYKAHRRGELGIALSSVFGGMTQVMFLLVPFSMVAIGVLGLFTGSATYSIPINTSTTMLMILLFPLFYVLLEFIEEDHTLSNLDAAAMTAIYSLSLYFLFTAPEA